MFYQMGSVRGKYVYVYDDIDKSVELTELAKVESLGIGLTLLDDFKYFTLSDIDIKRLHMIGVEDALNGIFAINICSYTVSGVSLLLAIDVVHDNILVDVIFKKPVEITDTGNRDICVFRKLSKEVVYTKISVCMFKYLLNLKVKRDFNGIMRCFNDFLGIRLGEFIDGVSKTDCRISDIEWYD